MNQGIKKKKISSDNAKIDARRQAGEEIRRDRVVQKGRVNYKELINYGRKYL